MKIIEIIVEYLFVIGTPDNSNEDCVGRKKHKIKNKKNNILKFLLFKKFLFFTKFRYEELEEV